MISKVSPSPDILIGQAQFHHPVTCNPGLQVRSLQPNYPPTLNLSSKFNTLLLIIQLLPTTAMLLIINYYKGAPGDLID